MLCVIKTNLNRNFLLLGKVRRINPCCYCPIISGLNWRIAKFNSVSISVEVVATIRIPKSIRGENRSHYGAVNATNRILRITIERIVRHQTVGEEAGLGICLSGNRNRDERREERDKERDERLKRGEPIYSPLSKPVEQAR